MTTLHSVMLRGAVALGLSLAGLSAGYVIGAPAIAVTELASMRESRGDVAIVRPVPVIALHAPQARRQALRSTRVTTAMSPWNHGVLLR